MRKPGISQSLQARLRKTGLVITAMHDCPEGIQEADQQKQGDQAEDKFTPDSRSNQWRQVILFAGNAIDLRNGNSLIVRQ
ncbi:hypothetical protein DOZ80_30250 [Pseudomonas fluorescens]|uniref:Uncharacterized protein n=1 Tax=Pseudomonas fluorescens TaxID=294 RepID=A0A327MJE5_PSEFL|nr:hypothetical protein DOZ80_30250 [Pseudomonas fluorescens]